MEFRQSLAANFSVPFSLKGSSKYRIHVNVHKLYAVEYINTVCILGLSISISNFLKLLNKLYKVSPYFYILNISKILGIPIENRIYREEFTRKKCKTAILLYCFHTAGVLHIFMLYNLLGPGTSFYRKSKISIKRKSNYKIGWFQN